MVFFNVQHFGHFLIKCLINAVVVLRYSNYVLFLHLLLATFENHVCDDKILYRYEIKLFL